MKINEKEFENILQDLKSIASEMGAKVRFERGDFKGGYCLLLDSKVIVINNLSSLQKKVAILSSALTQLGADNIYIPPKIREVIGEMDDSK
jgi:hypothetical protein